MSHDHNGRLKGRDNMGVWLWLIIIIFTVIIALFLIVSITKLTITLSLYHGNDNDHFTIKFRAWHGLIKYTLDIPYMKLDEDGPNIVFEEDKQMGEKEDKSKQKKSTKKVTPNDFLKTIHDAKELLVHVREMHRIIKHFLSKVIIDNVHWHTLIGSGDAATTGTLSGAIWAAKGSLIGVISNYMRLQKMPDLNVIPSFQRPIIQTSFSCIIQFRLGNAILVGIKLLRYWRGRADFKTKPLSIFSDEKHSV
ncbi:DUF2953 domain-containing protein [Bacillus seohaeanensis]|uniref:DUF2953 domain-containing protein n=1 Tax=Bacillus seohaeanensis TaxID=284580 RepID=A0ABW5RTD9_9BACI